MASPYATPLKWTFSYPWVSTGSQAQRVTLIAPEDATVADVTYTINDRMYMTDPDDSTEYSGRTISIVNTGSDGTDDVTLASLVLSDPDQGYDALTKIAFTISGTPHVTAGDVIVVDSVPADPESNARITDPGGLFTVSLQRR